MDPISQLNQYDHGRFQHQYFFSRQGKGWDCECVSGTKRTQGFGQTKKAAKQSAALAMLRSLLGTDEDTDEKEEALTRDLQVAASIVLEDMRHALKVLERALQE